MYRVLVTVMFNVYNQELIIIYNKNSYLLQCTLCSTLYIVQTNAIATLLCTVV